MQSTKSFLQKKWFIYVICLVAVGIGASVMLALKAPVFETNDDVMLKAIACGDITGSPDAHLVYIMYPLGLFFKFLYSVFPTVPCYDIFMVSLRIAVMIIVVLRACSCGSSTKQRILFCLIASTATIAADVSYLWVGQYTPLAAFCAGAAIFILASSKEKEGKIFWVQRIAVIALLVVSLNLRKQVLLLSLPIVALVILYKALTGKESESKDNKKYFRNGIIYISVLAMLFVASVLIDKAAYSSEEWKTFLKYNDERTDIYDYYGIPSYDGHSKEYEALNIKESDMYPLAEYDLELFEGALSKEMPELSDMAKHNWKEQRSGMWVVKAVCKELVGFAFGTNGTRLGFGITVAVAAVIFIANVIKQRKITLMAVMLFAYQEVVSAYFLYRQRFPERVSHSLYLFVLFGLLGLVLSKQFVDKMSERKGLSTSVALFAAVLITVVAVMSVTDACKKQTLTYKSCEEWDSLNSYFAENEDKLYLLKTNSFSNYGEKLFTVGTYEGGNTLRMGTWICKSPLYEKKLQRIGTKDVYDVISSGEDIYWVQDSKVSQEWIESFWKERYGEVSVTQTDTVKLSDERYASIYRITVIR